MIRHANSTRCLALFLLLYPLVSPPAGAVGSVEHPDKVMVGLERDHIIDLNGPWRFRRDPEQVGIAEGWMNGAKVDELTIRVPLPWQLADESLRDYTGTGWYERRFSIPAEFADKRIAVGFHGIDNYGAVWVNGRPAGKTDGAQAPFLLDITELVNVGAENTITIEVTDPPKGTSFFMDTHSLVRISGLWRDVWIEATGKSFVSSIFMVPDIDHSQAKARVAVYATQELANEGLMLDVSVIGPEGVRHEIQATMRLPEESAGLFVEQELIVEIPEPRLWDIDHPHLYRAEVSLTDGAGRRLDTAAIDFGMRKLSTHEGRILLNDKPIYIVGGGADPGPFGGAVDVNWHEPPPYAYPTDEQIQSDIAKAKSLGVNFLRVPLRPMHPRFMYWADRMGVLIMQGGPWTPTEGIGGEDGFRRYKDKWARVVLRDRNHASMAVWELFNESFGLGPMEFQTIAGKLYDHIKVLDGTRFVLDNAGGAYLNELNYIGNHGKSDIEDVHSYPGFPTFFAEGGEARYPATSREIWSQIRWVEQPVLVTEFAPSPYVYNIKKIKEKWGGEEPWWFQARQTKSAMPAQWDLIGFEERFDSWHIDQIYGGWDGYVEASDWYHYWGLKDQTQVMRMNPELSGFVAWLFDSAPHPVGEIDFYKDIKVYGDELAKIWTQDLVIIDETRKNYWEGENLYASVYVSHFGAEDLEDAKVVWWLEGSDLRGEISGVTLPRGHVKRVGDIAVRLPEVQDSSERRLYARLVTGEGKTVSENYERAWIYPRKVRRATKNKRIAVHGLESHRFSLLGYEPVGLDADPKPVVLVGPQNFDAAVQDYVNQGGTAIMLINRESDYWERRTLPRILPIENLLARNDLFLGRKFQGGHSDSFYARKGLGVFDSVKFENPYVWPFKKAWPERVIGGVKSENWNDVLAGAHGNLFRSIPRDSMANTSWTEISATLMQFRCGEGRLLISTFNLSLPMLDDPVAALILHGMIDYAHTDFTPGAEFRLE